MDSLKQTIAIIGAGPSGLFTAYALSPLFEGGASVAGGSSSYEFEVFEKQETIGGQWVFSGETHDKYGQPTHSGVYDNLFLNIPKEGIEIPSFPFPPTLPSYLTRQQMTNYINGFA